MNIKKMATMTILEDEDGDVQCIITSHPNGNEIEEVLKVTVNLINTMIKESKKDTQ